MTAAWQSYEDRLNRVSAYIYEHLDEELDLNRLADVAALSPWHWHRVYQAIRGETVAATVRRLRLERAVSDLVQTKLPVEEVAKRAGYDSLPSFTRIFAEAFGMPPAQYRRRGSHTVFAGNGQGAPNRRYDVRIGTAPAPWAIALPHRGSFMQIGQAFGALFGRLASTGQLPPDAQMIGIFYDDPTIVPEAELRSAAGLLAASKPKAEAPLEAVALHAGPCAILRHQGPYGDMGPAYRWLLGTWLPQSGRELADAPILETYLNSPENTAPPDLLTDIYLPLRS